MESTVFFKTSNGSFYLYDMKKSILLNSHPLLESIYKLKSETREDNINELLCEMYPDYTRQEIVYYIQKYNYLLESGFFQLLNTDEMLSGTVSTELVESNLANLANILFQVTGDCNLSCKYCCYGDMYTDNTTKNPMSKETVDKVFDYMLPYWKSSKNLSFHNPVLIGFYGGEPLLNFSLVNYIISRCEELQTENFHFTYSMTTNGVLLNRYMDFLVDKNVSLLISLDGNKSHNQLRVNKNGEESFDRIYKNVKLLQQKYPTYFEEKVNINAVLNKYSSSEEVHHFIKSEFSKTPLIESIAPYQLENNKVQEYMELYQPYTESAELIKERMNHSSAIMDLSFFFYYLLNNSYKHYSEMVYDMSKRKKKLPTGTCLPFYLKMFVTSDGNILACERVGLDYILGTITDKVNMDFQKIADIYTHYFSHIKEQCQNCYSMGFCGQCLFQLPQENELHICPHIHDKETYQNYLARLMSTLEEMPELFHNINKMVSA